MTARSLPLHVCSLLALTVLSFCAGCASKHEPVRIGINAWPGYEFLYLAQEKGFYRDEGLDVRLTEFGSLTDCRRAFERGQIDVMGTTVVEVLLAREDSASSPEIIQVVDYSDGADVILAHAGIVNGAGLRGVRIGVEQASLGLYVLARGLEKNGLSLADVKVVPLDQVSMEDAFRRGEIAAVVTYPPTSTKLLRHSSFKSVFSTSEIPGEVVDVIASSATLSAERPGDVAKLIRAYHRAIAYTAQHPEDAYRIMAEREGITPREFADALTDGLKLVAASEQAAYFEPGGKLQKVVDNTDRLLRQSELIKGPDRRAGVINASHAAENKTP